MSDEVACKTSCSAAATPEKGLSRRDVFRTGAIVAGGVALLSAGLAPQAARAQAAKMPKATALYQDQPKGDQSCATCALFQAPSTCGVVEGPVAASGWCKLYQKKS